LKMGKKYYQRNVFIAEIVQIYVRPGLLGKIFTATITIWTFFIFFGTMIQS